MSRRKRIFWQGFAAGTAVGFGSFALINLAVRARRKVVRMEKSIQIGRPVEEVFGSWTDFERLPSVSNIVEEVSRRDDKTHWKTNIDGKRFEWDAEIEQFIPNQAIGWKSVSGPKHTGRISFSPVGNDTMMHVVMNYHPPLVLLRPFFPPLGIHLENFIDQVLRDFKASLEGKGQEGREPLRATGTFGPGTAGPANETSRATGFRSSADVQAQSTSPHTGDVNPVEFTRPPEAKS